MRHRLRHAYDTLFFSSIGIKGKVPRAYLAVSDSATIDLVLPLMTEVGVNIADTSCSHFSLDADASLNRHLPWLATKPLRQVSLQLTKSKVTKLLCCGATKSKAPFALPIGEMLP